MEVKCMVQKCRYNTSHYTNAHQCGSCKEYGHGIIECEDNKKLINYDNKCKYCNNNKHTRYCPMNGTDICDTVDSIELIKELDEHAKDIKGGEYSIMYGGMGCCWYIRKNIKTSINEYFFLHSDNQGQYGKNTSHIPRYNAFIENYILK